MPFDSSHLAPTGAPHAAVRWWRWGAVAVAISVLALLPGAAALLPAHDRPVSAAELLRRIRASSGVAYQGYAESRAGLGLPDVPRGGRVVALLGEVTKMRAWVLGPHRWRVDELTPVGERDTYLDPNGTWLWDSADRLATRTKGSSVVRFARPADLLPPELGRRLAAAARADEIRRLDARRVAGVDALGLRIVPRDEHTTIGRIDVWADPDSGLPVRVEVTARGGSGPILTSSFLDLDAGAPPSSRVVFEPPSDASFDFTVTPDFAQAVDRYSPFVLPTALGRAPRRSRVARAAATYGRGYSVVAVLALPERYSPQDELDALREVTGPWGTARLVHTPLLNGMVFERDGVAFVLGGSVRPATLERVATSLARRGPKLR